MAFKQKFTPLIPPKIDPRNERELVESALLRTYERSGRTLNDFSLGSPVRVLTEALAFCYAELLYYTNKLPLAIAIQFLQLAGIQRRLGAYSQVELTFTLSQSLSEAYLIPKGFTVLTTSRDLKFKTDEQLVLDAGEISGVVSATCTSLGSVGNVASGEIDSPLQNLPYLDSATNLEPSTGGQDSENLNELKSRAFKAIRRRGLITAKDFEEEAQRLLGGGSIVKAIPNLAKDGVSKLPGSAHLFVLRLNGTPLNDAELKSVRNALETYTPLGIALFVSNAESEDFECRIFANLLPGVNPDSTALACKKRLTSFLSPSANSLGAPVLVDDIRFIARASGGVDFIEYTELNNRGINLNPTKPWAWLRLAKLDLIFVSDSNSFRYNYEF